MPNAPRYTVSPLAPGDPRFVARTPGASEILRLFPSPSLAGRGRISVEGGVSVVAGPGMGKTSLLRLLADRLDEDRGLATALLALPASDGYAGDEGFYAYLGHIVVRLRESLSVSRRMSDPVFAPVSRALADEPPWDHGGMNATMSPRGLARWIADLSAAATQTPGICMLFDDIDGVCSASWKDAFVAGLRFTFQTTAGITPVYGIWSLFTDEALPGSNYFRNVTRPVFLEPLSAKGERRALVDAGLSDLSDEAARGVFALAGGHPQLLQRCLGDLASALGDAHRGADLDAARIDALLGADATEAQRTLARALVNGTPGLDRALREIVAGTRPHGPVSKRLIATGLVDVGDGEVAMIPRRVAEIL